VKVDTTLFRALARLQLASPGAVRGRQQGERRSKAVGSGVEFADHRPYHPGDDLRRVDWNAWQRQPGHVVVRLFSEDRNLRVNVVVDATGSMGTAGLTHSRSGRTKLDHAGTLAAGFALLGLVHRDNVRVGTYGAAGGDRSGPTVAWGHDMAAMPGLLDLLKRTVAGQGCEAPQDRILALAGGRPADRSVLLSDMLAPEAEIESTLRALATIGHHPLLLHVVSPDDLEPDLSKPQRLVDAETGESVEVPGGPAVARAWAEAREAWLSDLDARCRRLGVRRVLARTDADPAFLFRDTLRRAGVVRLGARG